MPSSFLRHCGHFLGTGAHKLPKRENKKDPTKRHEAQQSSPKPSKLWVWVHERGQQNGRSGSQKPQHIEFHALCGSRKYSTFVHRDGPKPKEKRVSSIFWGKGSQNWLPGELQTREKTSFRFCRDGFQNFALCRMLKTRGKGNGPIP